MIAPQSEAEWEIIDTISPKVKEEALKAYTEAALQKLEQKVKEGMAYEGKMTFWERIMVKIIDNIQITVKYDRDIAHRYRDVHIRFEDRIFRKSPYAFGFTLHDLTVITTNESWTAEYIDRTEEANRDRPLHKHLTMGDLAFYWDAEEASMVSTLPSEAEIEAGLRKAGESIQRRDYILKPCNKLPKKE